MQAIILAAGKGTRLQPITLTMSKGMIPLANRPILAWTRQALDFCSQVIIIANKSQADILDYFSHDKKVKIIFQEDQLGTGDALMAAEKFVTDRFIVIYGDDIYSPEDIKGMATASHETMAMGTYTHDMPGFYGVVESKNGIITDLEEKPKHPKSNLVNCGLYMFNKKIFETLKKIKKSSRGEYELTDAIKLLIDEGIVIKEHRVSKWIPITYPWNILDANKYLLEKNGSIISPDAVVRPGAVIEEPVAIDAGATIGPNCFIRKYSSIGKNCKVGQAVEVKNSIIMDNSFVSHLSYVGDTIVGRNCNVGGGTIFANLRLDDKNVKMEINGVRVDSGHRKLGGIIGDNVKFGIRVAVMPGKRVWPNILIPACHTVDEDIKSELPIGKSQKNGE